MLVPALKVFVTSEVSLQLRVIPVVSRASVVAKIELRRLAIETLVKVVSAQRILALRTSRRSATSTLTSLRSLFTDRMTPSISVFSSLPTVVVISIRFHTLRIFDAIRSLTSPLSRSCERRNEAVDISESRRLTSRLWSEESWARTSHDGEEI